MTNYNKRKVGAGIASALALAWLAGCSSTKLDTPAAVETRTPTAPPAAGAHDAEILAELQLAPGAMQALLQDGAATGESDLEHWGSPSGLVFLGRKSGEAGKAARN